VRREHGSPSLIVNCAGLGAWKFLEDTPPEESAAMIAAPYLAASNLSHAFLPDMLERRAGLLIHVGSPASRIPWPGATSYSAARWALRGLHEALCQDLVGTGVRSCHVVFGEVSARTSSTTGSPRSAAGASRLIRRYADAAPRSPATVGGHAARSCTPSCCGCST
jgi:short-subunit dehydrogenase